VLMLTGNSLFKVPITATSVMATSAWIASGCAAGGSTIALNTYSDHRVVAQINRRTPFEGQVNCSLNSANSMVWRNSILYLIFGSSSDFELPLSRELGVYGRVEESFNAIA
jgi:hypothetical protein